MYGAKCIAVRDAILDLHGMPARPWTRLSETVLAGNNTLHLLDPVVDWKAGDHIFVTSTSFDPSFLRVRGKRLDLTVVRSAGWRRRSATSIP